MEPDRAILLDAPYDIHEHPTGLFPERADEFSTSFPSEPLDKARYKFVRDLGEGTQATVGEYKDGDEVLAIKTYQFQSSTNELYHNIQREIEIMGRLSGQEEARDYMVSLIRWHKDPDNHEIKLVMSPVASEGSLCDLLLRQFDETTEVIGEQFLLNAIGNLAQGLAFIHLSSMRHKDINTQNVLIHKGRAIYADFGISLIFNCLISPTGASFNPTESTLYENAYAAPEIVDGAPRSTKSDVFSLGCVFWELLAARSVAVLGRDDYKMQTGFHWGENQADGYARRVRDGSLGMAFERIKGEDGMQKYGQIVDVIEMMMSEDPDERIEANDVFDLMFG